MAPLTLPPRLGRLAVVVFAALLASCTGLPIEPASYTQAQLAPLTTPEPPLTLLLPLVRTDGSAASQAVAAPTRAPDLDPTTAMYAKQMNVSYAEAQRRLRLQGVMGSLGSTIAQNEPTYAGSWLEHTPKFGLVVAFTSPNGDEIIQKYLKDVPWADEVTVQQAPYTMAELENMQMVITEAAIPTGLLFASGINIPLAKVNLYTNRPDALRAALESGGLIPQYLDDIEYVYQASPAAPAAANPGAPAEE